MADAPLPLRVGAEGDAVRDLRGRLDALGFASDLDAPGRFGDDTEAAVRAFQEKRGLRADGVCGRQTWEAIVEAGWRLGDRLLYLTAPMLRGDDVADLQRRLGAIGFDAGRVDGIFGPTSLRALQEFQRNAGLTTDGICGPDTVTALARLGRSTDDEPIARIREVEHLRHGPRDLAGQTIVVTEPGGLGALAEALGRALGARGALPVVLHEPDERRQATQANELGASLVIGLVPAGGEPAVHFYGRPGFASVGGRRLAELILAALPATIAVDPAQCRPMTLPLLRETRMPAVVVELGPPRAVVAATADGAEAVARAVATWAATSPDTEA